MIKKLKKGGKFRGDIVKDGNQFYKNETVKIRHIANRSTFGLKAFEFDVFSKTEPQLKVKDKCQFLVDGQSLDIQVISISPRPLPGDLFMITFAFTQENS